MGKEGKTFKEWFGSRKVQRYLVIFTFMFLPLLLLLMFTYIPFGKMIRSEEHTSELQSRKI